MKRPRLLPLLMTLVLTLSLTAPAAAYHPGSLLAQTRTYSTPFADTQGTWCDTAVQTCYETGLMDGKSATSFAPQSSLTYGQIVVIVARLHELLHGGDGKLDAPAQGEAWYQPAADYLSTLPTLQQVQEDLPTLQEETPEVYLSFTLWVLDDIADQPCTRHDFVYFLSAILPESALTAINSITSLPDVMDDPAILAFYNAGILTGSNEYGSFNGLDTLNRGQAAAMLARIVDPSQRVHFTPKKLVLSQVLLGKDPEEIMMKVDGFDITADVYAILLTLKISEQDTENYLSRYALYPEEFSAYLNDAEFEGDFADYLLQKYGIDLSGPIDWNTPDKGGMTLAQKVLSDVQEEAAYIGVLMNHEKEYPLTQEQRTEMEELSYLINSMGITQEAYKTMSISQHVLENLQASLRDFTSGELSRYLTDQNNIYGMYAVFYRDNAYSIYSSDQEIREAASTLRSQIYAHRDDQEYISYLIWKYSEEYSGEEPDLISLDSFSDTNIATLKSLGVGEVSPVLTEDDAYVVVWKMDPSEDEAIVSQAAAIPAQEQLAAWCASATITDDLTESVDVALAAQALEALGQL